MNRNDATFRSCILESGQECLVYGADNLAQFTRPAGTVFSKCDRALACATQADVVILDHRPDPEYQAWLRGLGLGTDHLAVYTPENPGKRLADLVTEDPKSARAAIAAAGKAPVYFPWLSGKPEQMAAGCLGADLFGARATLTRQYNDKIQFKQICRDLGIPMVEGGHARIDPDDGANFDAIRDMARACLGRSPEILIRAAVDNTGLSMAYRTDGRDLAGLYHTWTGLKIDRVVIEPFLPVRYSPGDQWLITRSGNIVHRDMRNQVMDGQWHKGNIKTPHTHVFDWEKIRETSLSIVSHMAGSGYVGVVGIDYIQTDTGVYPVENNARVNGSTYVLMIVDRIEALSGPVPCWKSLKAQTTPCGFRDLARRTKGILYNGGTSRSYFPYNCFALDKTGAFAVILMAEDMDALAELEREMNGLGIH